MSGHSGPSQPAVVPRVGVAIPAAGMGRRMGGLRKAWLELHGEPLLVHALRPFLADPRTQAVCVALSPDEAAPPPRWLVDLDSRIQVVAGGATRAASVAQAVAALPPDLDQVLVHDAARPLVTRAVIDRVVERVATGVGAVAGLPAIDTVKLVDADGAIERTPQRDRVWMAQTPQGFPASMLRRALDRLEGHTNVEAQITDDASLVELLGERVEMVEGDARNFKVTRPDDLDRAAEVLRSIRESEMTRLLFVCTGNTCRSPMAEVIAQALLRQRGHTGILVESAGVAAVEGIQASRGAMRAAERAELDLSQHRARQLTAERLEAADVVLAMTPSHLAGIQRMGGGERAFLLTSYASSGSQADPATFGGAGGGVPDPFGGTDAEYQTTFDALPNP